MTVAQLQEALTAANIPFPANATKAELQALLTAQEEASSDAESATPPSETSTTTPSVAGLFSTAPTRLEQASFTDVAVGMETQAVLSSFRRSRNNTHWLGTFRLGSYGTVTCVIGETSDFSMTEVKSLKGDSLTLTYSGSQELPTRDNGKIVLPRFRVAF